VARSGTTQASLTTTEVLLKIEIPMEEWNARELELSKRHEEM
jgi:hypothetical protein